jgi:sulfide:quinone oxidoreductase
MEIAIVGAGFGGITAALELSKSFRDKATITLVDRAPDFYIGLTKLWVMAGLRKPEEVLHPRERLNRDGIRFLNAEVNDIDLDKRSLATTGGTLSFDKLIVSCGLDVRADAVPGLTENGLNLYSIDGATEINRRLNEFRGGEILILICAPPYKCPPAPYEAAMLVDDLLRKRGVRITSNLVVATPEPRPLPVLPTETGERVRSFLTEREIGYLAEHKAVSIEKDRVEFEGKGSRPFDLLIAIPPHRPPSFVQSLDGLTTPNGWIKVDADDLRTPRDDVFAVGDIAAVMTKVGTPIPRAGVFAEAQAKVVASNIAAEMNGSGGTRKYEGIGYCFLEVGDGRAMKVEGDFLADPKPDVKPLGDPTAEKFAEKERFEAERVKAWFG